MINYIERLPEVAQICNEFREDIVNWAYDNSGAPINNLFCFTPRYERCLNEIAQLTEVLGFIGDYNLNKLFHRISLLKEPRVVSNRRLFKNHMDNLIRVFSSMKQDVIKKIKWLRRLEIKRLNEAVCCYFNECYRATVAMAVSAVEYKLLTMLKKGNPKSSSNLGKMTLGQLIAEYVNNKDAYGNIIPKKHEPLLDLCNTYRVFSVHPKKENINHRVASSVLNLSFDFLLD